MRSLTLYLLAAAMGASADAGWSTAASIPEPLQEMHAAVLKGRIYIAGGFNVKDDVTVVSYRLDPAANRWERIADLPAGRHHMPLVVANDTLYAVGGLSAPGFDAVATLWIFEDRENRWVERAPLPEPRGAGGAAVVGGQIVLVGGYGTNRKLLDSIAIYNPRANSWRHGAPIPTLRDHLGVAAVGGTVYAAGGRPLRTTQNMDVLEAYDVKANQWTAMTSSFLKPCQGRGLSNCFPMMAISVQCLA